MAGKGANTEACGYERCGAVPIIQLSVSSICWEVPEGAAASYSEFASIRFGNKELMSNENDMLNSDLLGINIAPTAQHRPRLHDLRHTFAVRALQGCSVDRSRTGARMVALATYMGHVNIYATYWYLEATAELMHDIASAGEAFIAEGRQS